MQQRQPVALFADPVCGVGLLAFESKPDTLFPTFITKYDSDAALRIAEEVERVELEVFPNRTDSTEMSLLVISHVTCKCVPRTKHISHQVSPETVVNFFGRLAATKCFVWVLSTPSKEIRFLIRSSDNTIQKRYENERTLQ